jgi:hypothetical protein
MPGDNQLARLASAEWDALQAAVERFEAAWQSGQEPRIEDALSDDPARCLTLLRELVHVDLERRLKRGQTVRVEQYLQRFPELAGDTDVAVELIAAECACRQRLGDTAATPEVYLGRFPHYADRLRERLASTASGSALAAGMLPLTNSSAMAVETRPESADGTLQKTTPLAGPSLPQVPGYETLAVLGRGAMGIVYQARHTQLPRLVALKMIRGGASAGPEELQRFRTEAEAIARLQHAHIVQIFEVGEHDGLPFLALEYCAGGSLEKKLAGTPLPPQETATLLAQLARAMHAAHARGIVHRDLKPANVLLAEDGTPKIGDFGLAKQLDVAGQTATGTVMGTPSYMAPEQARGQSKTLGPACDIYALGAILYHCLTGRPPFVADHAVATLALVLHVEPVPPAQLNPRVPRDLETICLKCLRKEPGQRFTTALALADDLRRFQHGEPIQARPRRRWEKAWKWCGRNVAATFLIAGLMVLGVRFAALNLAHYLGWISETAFLWGDALYKAVIVGGATGGVVGATLGAFWGRRSEAPRSLMVRWAVAGAVVIGLFYVVYAVVAGW